MQIVISNGINEGTIGVFAMQDNQNICLTGFLWRFAVKHTAFCTRRRVYDVEMLSLLPIPKVCQRHHAMRGSCTVYLANK